MEPPIQCLEGLLAPVGEKKGVEIKGRKDQEKPEDVICPQDKGDGKIKKGFYQCGEHGSIVLSCPELYLTLQVLSYQVIIIDFTYKKTMLRRIKFIDYRWKHIG
jgi:hypothetical protein